MPDPGIGKPLDLLSWFTTDEPIPILEKFADWAHKNRKPDESLGVHPCPVCGLMHSAEAAHGTEPLSHEEGALGRGY